MPSPEPSPFVSAPAAPLLNTSFATLNPNMRGTYVALPGAGPGEIALVGQDVACLGDALIHLPPDGLRILPDKYCADPTQLRRSLRKLLSCDFQVMTFAHGVPLTDSPRTKLEPLIA